MSTVEPCPQMPGAGVGLRALALGSHVSYLGTTDTLGVLMTTDQPGAAEIETDPRRVAEIMADSLPHFTERGFDLVATPAGVHQRLSEAYAAGLSKARPEESDPDYLTAGDPEFIEIGDLAYEIGAELLEMHEAWSGQQLELIAAYGLRTYRRGQVLRWHGDRAETHVISAIIHIDNESDEPWPLHIVDHAGIEHEVCFDPGQMLFYESATCPHARPTPFAGEHYGSLFVHFKPVSGWEVTSDDIHEFLRLDRREN